jgi:leucyl aminopeptidase (aminopeptidase T)
MFKAIPGIGSVLGGASMSVMSGASTYAVGQVAVNLFSTSGSLSNFNIDSVKQAYEKAYEKGKGYVSDLKNKEDEATDVYQSLQKLGDLKEQGILSEEEFEAKKKELLSRI